MFSAHYCSANFSAIVWRLSAVRSFLSETVKFYGLHSYWHCDFEMFLEGCSLGTGTEWEEFPLKCIQGLRFYSVKKHHQVFMLKLDCDITTYRCTQESPSLIRCSKAVRKPIIRNALLFVLNAGETWAPEYVAIHFVASFFNQPIY